MGKLGGEIARDRGDRLERRGRGGDRVPGEDAVVRCPCGEPARYFARIVSGAEYRLCYSCMCIAEDEGDLTRVIRL